MSVLLTEPPAPAGSRHVIDKTVLEAVRRTDGWWLYRCPEIFPVNARHWRGPFGTETAALDDYREKIRPPRISRAELRSCKRQGYHGGVDGVETIMHLDPLTGATSLTPYELLEEPN